MKCLIAAKTIDGSFHRVGVYSIRKDGSMSLPMKFNGQIEGHLIRAAARTIVADDAVVSVDSKYGNVSLRISRMWLNEYFLIHHRYSEQFIVLIGELKP